MDLEAGEVHHLDTAFLLADGINHGLNLRKSMGLLLGRCRNCVGFHRSQFNLIWVDAVVTCIRSKAVPLLLVADRSGNVTLLQQSAATW